MHRTVIGVGKAVFVQDVAEKVKTLDRIVALFTKRTFEYASASLNRATVVRIDIESVKGKKHGYEAPRPG